MVILQRRSRYTAVALSAFAMIIGLACPLPSAQSHAASTNNATTLEVDTVKRFLDGLEKHDEKSMLDSITADAHAFRLRDSKLIVSKIEDVIASALRADDPSTPMREPIDNIQVKTSGNISTVMTTYKFYIGNKIHHCGHTIYGLVRVQGLWKIASIVDESATDCR